MNTNTKQISYGNRHNQEITVRAVLTYIQTSDRYATCQMQDSADLNLDDAFKALDGDNLGAAKASADRAARYVFGMLSDEYREITIALGTD